MHGNILSGPCINAGAMKRLPFRTLISLFVPAGGAALAQTSALSVEEARKIVRSYHVEDWAAAIRQLRGS